MNRYGNEIQWRRELLTADNRDTVSSFQCGVDYINFGEYLKDEAVDDTEARTYVYIDEETNKAFAYASIACTALVIDNAPNITTYEPAVLIDKFIVDEEYRHMPFSPDIDPNTTLSTVVFAELIDYVEKLTQFVIGAKHLVLYATDERARCFYGKCNVSLFTEEMIAPNDPDLDECTPMYRRI